MTLQTRNWSELSASTSVVMELAGKHSDHYFRRWQANIVTTINIFFEKKEEEKKSAQNCLIWQENVSEKYFEIFYPSPPSDFFFFEKN